MQQEGGSQYGAAPLEMVPPISSRSGAQNRDVLPRSPASFFDELGGGGGGGGEERGGRWPRQETVALLKIRSEMDAGFRDATLKGPLWEDVSRKMAEMGFKRSSKKCKEKFENVHKYYKRTKEGRAGRQDGKSYRFFTQLEALHGTTAVAAAATDNVNSLPPLSCGASMASTPIDGVQPPPPQLSGLVPDLPHAATRISFSSNTSSSSSDSDGDDTDDVGDGAFQDGGRKRKRKGWPCGSGKTMAFFEGLIKQLVERQEVMQQRFLETIEKREQDRMVREEAWKRQEMARLNREHELMAHERTMTANRDAAVISFLQKFANVATNAPNPFPEASAIFTQQPPEPSPVDPPPPPREEQLASHQTNEIATHQPSISSEPAASSADAASLSLTNPSPSSRWPKAEVLALIRMRSGLEAKYQESGPKAPLWEEISFEMRRIGYNRSTKRCKEKWENINKYFKKVKEGSKKRPLDAKTCPYFHELDALYSRKQQQESGDANPVMTMCVSAEKGGNNGGQKNEGNHEGSEFLMVRSNGNGHSQDVFGDGLDSANDAVLKKKPEDIVRELMERHNDEEDEDDDVDNDDDYEDDEEENGKMRYEIQFQRQNVGAAGGSRVGNAAGNVPVSAPPSSNASSFLAMVQ